MSEERRKRQQERDGSGGTSLNLRKYRTFAVIVVLFAVAYYAGWRHSHRYDAFAKCLTAKQAKMYGLYWCPHCIEQKEMFSKSFEYVTYQECGIKGSHDMAPECKAAGVKLFPSWQFGNNPPKEGVLPLEELGDKTGCSLP